MRFALISIWIFHLCLGDVISLEPTNSCNISNDLSNDIKQHIFSTHFRQAIFGLYNKNFTNFPDITHIAEIGDDVNFNADVLLGLHDAMSEAHHTDMPFRAYKLYEKIEAHINYSNLTLLNPAKHQELEHVREELLFKTIVPKGAHILESAVYTNGYKEQGTAVRELLDLLYFGNQTMKNLIIDDMITRVRWTLPIEEIIPILADLSPHLEQNVDILLALYDQGALQADENLNLSKHLMKLRKRLEYEWIGAEKKLRVNEIILLQYPLQDITSKDQLRGRVCFYQKLSDGNRRYMHQCHNDNNLCTYDSINATAQDVFHVDIDVQHQIFFFRSRYFNDSSLCYDSNVNSKIFSSESECNEIHWSPQFQDGKVDLKMYKENSHLCANGLEDESTSESMVSIVSNSESDTSECKWFIEDCNHFI